jgi:hypothetical protein
VVAAGSPPGDLEVEPAEHVATRFEHIAAGLEQLADRIEGSRLVEPERLSGLRERVARSVTPADLPSSARVAQTAGACPSNQELLCLAGGRFEVEVTWTNAPGAPRVARAVALGERSGYFWLFSRGNPEVFVKLLDACGVPVVQSHLAFVSGLSNLALAVEVRDTLSGTTRVYRSNGGRPFPAVMDGGTFSSCP